MPERDTFLDLVTVVELGPTLLHKVNAARLLALDVIARRAEHGMDTRQDWHPAAAYRTLPALSLVPGTPASRPPKADDPWFWFKTGFVKAPHTVDGGSVATRALAGERLGSSEPTVVSSAKAALGGAFDAARAVWEARMP
jgi:hypothetical protein